MADATETGRLVVDPGEQEEAVRRGQIGRRSLGDLLVEVDPGLFAVVDQRPVSLANKVGIEGLNPRIPAVNPLEGESHGDDANALQNFSNLRAMPFVTPGTVRPVLRNPGTFIERDLMSSSRSMESRVAVTAKRVDSDETEEAAVEVPLVISEEAIRHQIETVVSSLYPEAEFRSYSNSVAGYLARKLLIVAVYRPGSVGPAAQNERGQQAFVLRV